MFAYKTVDHLPDNPGPLPDKLIPFIWYFVRQMKAQFYTIFFLFSISAVLIAVIPYFLQLVIEAVQNTENPEEFWPNLWWPIFWYSLLILLLQPIAAQIGNYIQARTLSVFCGMVRRQLALYMHNHSYQYYQDDFAGRLAGKVVETPSAMEVVLYNLQGAILYAVLMFIVSAFLYYSVDLIFGAMAVGWLVLYALCLAYYVPKIQKLSRQASDTRSHLRGRYVDILTNVLTVKLFARRKHEDAYLRESLKETSDAFIKTDVKLWQFWVVLEVMTSVFLVLTFGFALHGWQQGMITIAQFAMILPLTLQMINTSWWMSEIFTNFFQKIGEVQEGMDAIIQAQDVQDKENANPLVIKDGRVHFDAVNFAYGGKSVFENLNIDIPPGQKVGLVGPSGAGKSTLIQILLRLYDVQDGTIKIDDQNIAAVKQDSLRDNIAVIPQMNDLLHRSIRDNILYGRFDAGADEVIEAAKKAHAHEFIMALVDKDGNIGYDAMVGERGVKLSGGQRQRIAIARAILKNAPILVLDEATSALDSESERLIQDSLFHLMQGKTVIAIAHRLSTIAHLDRLLVMQDGKIIEDGPHQALLDKEGYYARLWGMQSGGFLRVDQKET